MKSAMLWLCCAIGALLSLPSAAQQAAASNPADPSVAVPPPSYESAFSGYVRQREEKLAPWREVNEEVARVGGHIGILRGPAPSTQGAAESKGK
jgi:hypothetical protein